MIFLAAEGLFFIFVLDPVLKDSNTMQCPLQINMLAEPATASQCAEEGTHRAIPTTHVGIFKGLLLLMWVAINKHESLP